MTEAALPTSAPESTSITRRLLSDERLARRAAQGDAQAFEAIYLRYHQKLFRFCLAMTANPQDAQDALQNTMVKVLRALPGEERQIKLKPWLFQIARNEAIEVQRKRHKNEELDVEHLTEGAVSDTAEVRERLRTLLADLDQLPERQRAVLLMRELSGLEFSEIGAAYETSEGAVRQALYEARLNLRALEEGRGRACAEVRRELSDADGRVIRRRRTRAHLRSCPGCRAFGDEIAARRQSLGAVAPLPLAVSAGVLRDVLGQFGGPGAGAAGGGGAGIAATLGAGAGQTLATSAAIKSGAVAAAAVLAIVAGDRTGLVDLPAPSGGGHSGTAQSVDAAPSSSGETAGRDAHRLAGDESGNLPAAAGGGEVGQEGGHADEPANAGAGSTGFDSGPAARATEAAPGESGELPAGDGSPPDGGDGSPTAEQRGGPEQLPGAASGGQETATERKPASPPGPPGDAGAPDKPAMPPQSENAPSPGGPGAPPAGQPPAPPAPVKPPVPETSSAPKAAPPAPGQTSPPK